MTALEDALNPERFDAKTIIEMEKQHMVPAIVHYYDEPKLMVKGKGAILYDSDGKEYIDLFAGICTVLAGYSHPTLTEAVKRQVDRMFHTSTLYPTAPMAIYARELARVAPEGLNKCFFVNSGSEANEAAIHTMKMHTGSNFILSLNDSFHGRTLMAMSITNQGTWRKNIAYPSGIIGVPNAYCYRCDFGQKPETCDRQCARYVEKLINCQTPNKIAGLLAEPIQGNGGLITPPDDYFQILVEIIHKYDGLFLADEVQTGFGRTGGKMWGIEHYGVKPDMITMAKGIGSGWAMGAFITTDEVAASLEPKGLFSTFGGNPTAMIAGLANLQVIQDEKFIDQAARKGAHVEKRLNEMMERHRVIGDVRGKGLMIGFELVEDRESKKPAADITKKVMNLAFKRGVLLGLGGLANNVIRIKPPIVISDEQLDRALDILDDVLKEAAGE